MTGAVLGKPAIRLADMNRRERCGHCRERLDYRPPWRLVKVVSFVRRRLLRYRGPLAPMPCWWCKKHLCGSSFGVCSRRPSCAPMLRETEVEILRMCAYKPEDRHNVPSSRDARYSAALQKLIQAGHVIEWGRYGPAGGLLVTSLSGELYLEELTASRTWHFAKRNWFALVVASTTLLSGVGGLLLAIIG